MKIGTRVVFTVLMLFIIALCTGIILAAFNVISPEIVMGLAYGFTMTDFKYVWAGAALIIALTCLGLIFFRSKKKTTKSVVLESDNGSSIAVTTDAVREVANNYLRTVEGSSIQRIDVIPVGLKTIKLNVALSVKQGVEVPVLTGKVKEEVKTYLEQYCGVLANEVNLKVLPQKPVAVSNQ